MNTSTNTPAPAPGNDPAASQHDATGVDAAHLAEIEFIDLGRMSYRDALARQLERHERVVAGGRPAVFFVEHDPVITVSRRDSAPGHLLASPQMLAAAGVEVQPTDRGGDITYHGPGQLVAYPILPLQPLGFNVRQYVHTLEQIVIDTLAAFDLPAHRDDEAIGVWVGGVASGEQRVASEQTAAHATRHTPHAASPAAKIAAVGVRGRRGVTMHGLALNVTTDLDHFQLIVPCGLTRPVTSMHQQLGQACPPLPAVREAMTAAVVQNFFRRA